MVTVYALSDAQVQQVILRMLQTRGREPATEKELHRAANNINDACWQGQIAAAILEGRSQIDVDTDGEAGLKFGRP